MQLLCKLSIKIKSYITLKKNGKINVGSRWEKAKGKNNLTCKRTTYGKGIRDYEGK
jgi:hypothetical protein